jgi:hypothetical protein
MSMSYNDVLYEMAISDLVESAIEEREKLIQCLYLFVEGKSEYIAFPRLLKAAGFSLEDNAVEIINIGGASNAKHVVKVLRKTISRNRPLVLVLDRDEAGIDATNNPVIRNDELTTIVHIPQNPIVKYANGIEGGEFEDAFDVETLVSSCFRALPPDQAEKLNKESILSNLAPDKPRLNQINGEIRKIIAGFYEIDKALLAERLAESNVIPESIDHLAQVLVSIREEHPILSQFEELDQYMDEL